MDAEKAREIIEAAKRATRADEFTEEQKRSLIIIHRFYEDWKGSETSDIDSKIFTILIKFKKAADSLLRLDEISNTKSWFDREAVKKAVQGISPLAMKMEELRMQSVCRPKRGRPMNRRVDMYISLMWEWFDWSFGSPGYGNFSIFPRLIHACLSLVDGRYRDKTPYKAIKRCVVNQRIIATVQERCPKPKKIVN